MNWFFWFLVILAAVFVWFLFSFVFKPLGKFFYHLYKDARDEIVEDNENTDKEKTKKN